MTPSPLPFVHLDSVPDAGICFDATLTDAWALDAATLALDGVPDDLEVHLQVDLQTDPTNPRARTGLAVTGTIRARFPDHCSRCLRPVHVRLDGPVDLRYMPQPETDLEEMMLSEDDLDAGWLDSGRLDMQAPVSEQLALMGRSRYRCEDQDVDLAEGATGACTVPTHEAGPDLVRPSPFAALANIRLPE